MHAVRKILVPTDFRRGARQALRHAVVLADQLGAELHVLHVLHVVNEASTEPARSVGWEAEDLRVAMRAEVYRYHRDMLERRHDGHLLTCCAVRQHTDVAQAILDYAGEQQVDLIVVDAYGHQLDDPFAVESTAERVMRHAPCDVLTSGLRGLYRTRRMCGRMV